jgi:hypothetical protein
VKPLARYKHTTGHGQFGNVISRMVPHDRGDYYAKDEADALIQRQSDTIQELGLRNAELEAERDKLSDAWDSLMQTASEQLVELAQLRAERDAARADAERWRAACDEGRVGLNREGEVVILHNKGDADAAIDAARSKE